MYGKTLEKFPKFYDGGPRYFDSIRLAIGA